MKICEDCKAIQDLDTESPLNLIAKLDTQIIQNKEFSINLLEYYNESYKEEDLIQMLEKDFQSPFKN